MCDEGLFKQKKLQDPRYGSHDMCPRFSESLKPSVESGEEKVENELISPTFQLILFNLIVEELVPDSLSKGR